MESVAPAPPMTPRTPTDKAVCAGVVLSTLVWTLGTGVVLGVKSARPTLGVAELPMQLLQPLHTLGVLSFLMAGMVGMFAVVMLRIGARRTASARWSAPAVGVFFLAAAVAILAGYGSGLEYTSWPLALTIIPLGVFGAMLHDALRSLRGLVARTPEGTWLMLVGLVLVPLGMIERTAGSGPLEPTRALMIEWHSLDTIFAGFNTALYGLGVLLLAQPGHGPSLRSPLLFGVATFSLLSTFGHHHYLSAQPDSLKIVAFAASMLGMVSFVRHARAFRRSRTARGAGAGSPLLRTGALWTLFAVGSGVLLAEPHINLLLHGTHAVVAHSMGAVIGVNVAIVLGALLQDRHESSAGSEDTRRSVRRLAWWFNILLALVVADMAAAGVAKGIMRIDGTHHDYQSVVRVLLTPLPVLGLALTFVVARLAVLIISAHRPRTGAPAALAGPVRTAHAQACSQPAIERIRDES